MYISELKPNYFKKQSLNDQLISRKRNFLLPKVHQTMLMTNGRKSSNLVKSHELVCHFIRLYVVPLPPYYEF
jgi:hypothetical protein